MKSSKFLGLGILMFVFMFGLASAAIGATTLVAPANVSNHTGTIALLNCTTGVYHSDNVSFMYNRTGGKVDATYGTIAVTVANTSANQTSYTSASLDISGYTDAATYNWSCRARNTSTTIYSGGHTFITIDNTAPVLTYRVDLEGDSQSYDRGIEYSCTSADGIDSSPTDTFNVTHPTEDTTSSTSLTVQSIALLFTDTDFPGDYVFNCRSEDYTGNSVMTSKTVTVDPLGRAKVVGSNNGGNNSWVWVVLIILAIWLWTSSKKK